MKKIILTVVVAALLALAISAAGRMTVAPVEEKMETPESPVAEKNGTPVIVELFTSEGCSSCPPADALLSQLEKTQPVKGAEVIALAQHVDYWNYLGWSDPFSSPAFSARQGEYARAFKKDGVYTPQMVVDGLTEFPGGNRNMAHEAITKAALTPKAAIRLTTPAQGPEEKRLGQARLSVNIERIPNTSDGDATEVLLAVTETNLSTNVARGENAGRKLNHVGVVRSLKVIGSVAQGEGAFTADTLVELGKGMRRENLRAVVFVQERASRRVHGAASVSLAEQKR